jgi:hypothetical protein
MVEFVFDGMQRDEFGDSVKKRVRNIAVGIIAGFLGVTASFSRSAANAQAQIPAATDFARMVGRGPITAAPCNEFWGGTFDAGGDRLK